MLHSVFMNIRFQIVGVAIQGQLKGALYLGVKEIRSDLMKKLKRENKALTNTQTVHFNAGARQVEGRLFCVRP